MTPVRPRSVRRRVALAGLALLGVSLVAFAWGAPPERCPEVTAGELQAAAAQAADWFARNQEADGTWLYQYDAEADEAIDDYNVVRHAGGIMGLYQAAGAAIPGALETADRGFAWAEDHLVERDDWAALSHQGRTATGATALLVSGLVERRAATGDDRYDDLMAQLGRFLAAQTEPSGAVLANYSLRSEAPEPGVYSAYFTGETYWAFAQLHRLDPDAGWGELADRVGDYMATRRDDVEDHWPPIPDHWAAYGLAETVLFDDRPADAPLTEAEVAYAEEQAGSFGAQVRWVAQRHGPWGALARSPQVPRGGGYGVVGEALTGLWHVAGAEPRLADLRAPLAERASCIAGLAVEQQVDATEAADYPDPGRAQGAWFRDGETRMDDQQHALSALLRTRAVVGTLADDADGADAPEPPAPAALLWIVALVAALNPVRAALAVPAGGPAVLRAGGGAGWRGRVGGGAAPGDGRWPASRRARRERSGVPHRRRRGGGDRRRARPGPPAPLGRALLAGLAGGARPGGRAARDPACPGPGGCERPRGPRHRGRGRRAADRGSGPGGRHRRDRCPRAGGRSRRCGMAGGPLGGGPHGGGPDRHGRPAADRRRAGGVTRAGRRVARSAPGPGPQHGLVRLAGHQHGGRLASPTRTSRGGRRHRGRPYGAAARASS